MIVNLFSKGEHEHLGSQIPGQFLSEKATAEEELEKIPAGGEGHGWLLTLVCKAAAKPLELAFNRGGVWLFFFHPCFHLDLLAMQLITALVPSI